MFSLKEAGRESFDTSLITFNTETGVAKVSTDSIEFDEKVVTLTITATSIASETDAKSVEATFQVEIMHPCRNVPLDPPEWLETFATFD